MHGDVKLWRSVLLAIGTAFCLGCDRRGAWDVEQPILEFRLPNSFSGVVLIAEKGRVWEFDGLQIFVETAERMSGPSDLGVIRFVRDGEVLVERPLPILYSESLEPDLFAAWGKRWVVANPRQPLRQKLEELGNGFSFAVLFVGTGADAKTFFDDSSALERTLNKALGATVSEHENEAKFE